MIKINDHYFAAWLKVVKEREIQIIDKSLYVNMSTNDYTIFLKEYGKDYKPIFKEVRNLVKDLASITSNRKANKKNT